MKSQLPLILSALLSTVALAEDQAVTPDQQAQTTASSDAKPEDKKDEKKEGAAAAAAPKKDDKGKNPLANAVQARTPEEQAAQSGFQFISSLDTYLGTGTFVNAPQYSYYAGMLTLIPQYLFGIGKQRLVASATVRASYEYSLPDAETGRRFAMFDTRVGVSAPAFFRDTKFTGIAFTPSLGLTIPTSLESWNAGMITSLNLGVTMSRSVKTVDFRAVVSGSRGFFGQPFSGVRNTQLNGGAAPVDANDNLLRTCRSGEPFCAFGGWNMAWSFSVGGQVQWRATGSFLVYAGYTYAKTWREAATPGGADEYTPKVLDSNGNPVAKNGYGEADRTSAFVGASYQLSDHYSLDLGVSTVQTPLHPTGEVRFPFLSIGTWADNNTSFYFTLSAAY